MSEHDGSVSALWRFPVKSMAGERVEVLHLDGAGAVGDRLRALHDVERGAVVSARRLPDVLGLAARYRDPLPEGPGGGGRGGRVGGVDRHEPPPVVLTLPDGTELEADRPGDAEVDAALSAALDREVRLVTLPRDRRGHRLPPREALAMADPRVLARDFGLDPDEPLPDFARMDVAALAQLARYGTPPGTFADLGAVHLLTEASLRAVGGLDARRFRPTVLVARDGDDLAEASWAGREVALGGARLAISMPTVRCVVPSREHADDLPVDRQVTRAVAQRAERFLGVYADVAQGGRVALGDPARVGSAPSRGAVTRVVGRTRDQVVRGALRLAGSTRRRER